MLTTPCPICAHECSIAASSCPACGYSFTTETSGKTERVADTPTSKLFPCPDCGHSCSTSALACPNCGRPFQQSTQSGQKGRDQRGVSDYPTFGSNAKKNRLAKSIVIVLLLGLVAGAVLLYIFLGRTKEGTLTGEVFIVTKGAQNVKLGLIQVVAIPEDKIRPFVEGKITAINVEYSKVQSSNEASRARVEAAQQAYNEAKTAYDDVIAKYSDAQSKAEKAQTDAYGESVGRDSEYDPSSTLNENAGKLQKQADRAKQQAAQLSLQVEKSRALLQTKEQELLNVKRQTIGMMDKLKDMLTNEALFKGLPVEDTKAITDAEGRFSMKVPASKKFALAARGQRRVFDSTEEYYWLVWVSLDGQETKHVMLTNQNLMGEDSPDSVLKSKDLIPTGITQN